MAKKSKTYANDPQATIKQRRKNRERAREKADKLISQVAQTGGYAITALGALGLGTAYKATRDDKKTYSNKKRYQQPRRADIDKVRKPNLFE